MAAGSRSFWSKLKRWVKPKVRDPALRIGI